LGFDSERTKREIIQYVRVIDSYYSQKTRELYVKKRGTKASSMIRNSSLASVELTGRVGKEDERGDGSRAELMKVFNQAVDEARKQIMRRRIKQEIINSNRSKSMSDLERMLSLSTELGTHRGSNTSNANIGNKVAGPYQVSGAVKNSLLHD
jgi:hypothetical protein